MGKDLEKVFSDSAIAVLQKRYVLKDADGKPIEDIDGLFHRVSDAIAKAELKYDLNADGSPSDVAMKKYDHYREEFYQMMIDRNFMPNSPTLMNAGKPDGQLSACFVLPIEDSMEGIFDAIKNAALIHKSGGGTGFSFSRLRPEGSTVCSTGGVASGPISFMKAFDAATEAVKQGGCLIGSTYVLTENGPVQIKDLCHGMKVLTACGYYPCTDPWMTKQGADVWLLSTLDFNENSFSIVATPDHPILTGITEEGYVYTKLQDLKVGDTVINKCDASGDIDYANVVSIVRNYAVEDVWNVEVPDVHNYYVCNSMDTVGMFVSNTRRGANMGMLRVDHPDIKKFITVKNDLKTLNNFNISVAITDAFMGAVKNHTNYDIVDPHAGKVVDQYDANEIFDMIIDSAWRTGEPGVFFIDRTNDHNTLKEIYGSIEATNPCQMRNAIVASFTGMLMVEEDISRQGSTEMC